MKTTGLYFFDSVDIEHIRELLEALCQIKFVPHDSYHYGDEWKPKLEKLGAKLMSREEHRN
jgi:hypothetical protein